MGEGLGICQGIAFSVSCRWLPYGRWGWVEAVVSIGNFKFSGHVLREMRLEGKREDGIEIVIAGQSACFEAIFKTLDSP